MSSLRVAVASSAVMTACALGAEANALLQVTASSHIQNLIRKMDTLKFNEGVSLHDMKEHLNEFKDHVASVLQDPSAALPADIKLLTDLISQLDTIFSAELKRQKAHDVAEYDKKLIQHVKCTTDKDKRIGTAGDVTKDQTLVSEKREKHKACRKAQQSFELFKSDAAAVGQALFGSAVGVAESTPVNEINTLCAKKDTWDFDSNLYKKLAKVDHVALCVSEQKDFEDTVCAALTAKASTCIAYDECIEAVDLSNEKSVTETGCSDRLEVEVVLAKTKCHLLHLSKVFNNEISSSDCDSVTVDNSVLPCSLQAVPVVSPCSNAADIKSPTLPSPTDCSAWLTVEYNFDASYQQVSMCQIGEQCILPTQIGTHDYSDGCIDSANYCAFYDRHRDACPDYAADDAATHCCACGGGTPGTPYVVSGDVVTWSKANGECELAQPKTQQDVDDIIAARSSDTGIWIGLTCAGSCANKQNWIFADGSIPDSSFPWEVNQPNSATAACAFIHPVSYNSVLAGTINDVPCEKYDRQFACAQ